MYSSATTVAEARWLDARGVDAVIAQGAEAGGHRGMFLTDDVDAQPGLMALLPQVVDAVACPGHRRRRHRRRPGRRRGSRARRPGGPDRHRLSEDAAGEDLGAHRQRWRNARDDATRVTNLFTGRPARGLLNRFMREHGP